MKRGTTFGKRLMAMLLALIMALSNIPGSVFAVTLPGSEDVVALSATVERVELESIEDSGYNYTLQVQKNEETVTVNEADIMWKDGVQTAAFESTDTGAFYASSQAQATALFTYEGVQMLVAYENENKNTTTFAVTHENWATKQVQVGVPFAAPVDTLADGVLAVTVTEELGENVEQAGDHYILNAMPENAKDHVLLTRTWKCGDAVLAQVQYAADAGVAELDNVQFMIGENKLAENVWYDGEQTVTVKVVDGELADSKYLPAVCIGEAVQTVEWNGEGTTDAPWTCEVKISGISQKLSIGSHYVMFNDDKTDPEIKELKAYVGDDDQVHVYVKLDAEFSGVESLVINDKKYTDQIEDNTLNVTLEDASEVEVVLTDKAGHEVSQSQAVQPKLEADLVHSAEFASENNIHYYNANTPLVFTMHVKGADEGDYAIAEAYLTVNGAKSDKFEYKAEAGTFAYTGADAALSGIELQVVDAMGRTASRKLDGTYVYDTTAPVVSFSVSAQTVPAEGEEAEDREAAMAQLENNKLYMGITAPDNNDVKFTLTANVSDANPVAINYAPSIDAQADEVTNFDLAAEFVDKAGNPAQKVSFTFGENTYYIELNNGKLNSTIYVDLERPYSSEGEMDIKIMNGEDAVSISKIYDENELQFNATVTDGNGVGVKTVEYQVDGGEFKTAALEDGKYIFDLDTTGEKQVTLYVVATDKLNNQNVAEVTVNIDTEAPQVDAVIPEGTNKVGNVVYFNVAQTVTVTVTDENFDAVNSSVTAKINGIETAGTLDGKVYTFTVNNGDTFSDLSYNIVDTVGHRTEGGSEATFCVDTDKPVVTVSKKADGVNVNTVNGVDYYDGKVTYTVSVSDKNLTDANENGQPQKLVLTYQFEGENAVTVSLPAAENGWTKAADSDTYTYDIVVENGKVINSISVAATDNAGNTAEKVTVEDQQGKTSFDGCVWNGNPAAVDTTDPVVQVTKSGKKTNTVGTTHYYDQAFTYTFTVTDQFMTSSPVVTVYYADGTTDGAEKNVNMSPNENNTFLGDDVWTGEITVNNGETVTGVSVETSDDANRKADSASVTDEDNITVFAADENGVLKSEGYSLIVDETAPTANVQITGDLAGYFYTNARTGKIYVKLNNPNEAVSGEVTQGEDEIVTLTVTVQDKNLSLIQGSHTVNNLTDNGAWETMAKDTLKYAQDIAVEPDHTGVLEFSLQVVDMAGNPVEIVTVDDINNTVIDSELKKDLQPVDGVFGGQVILDRQSPASGYDENGAPSITVDSSEAEVFTSNNGKDLYKDAFTYSFTVQDGDAEAGNSGLDKIEWSVEDAKGFVKNLKGEFTSFDDQPFEIPVQIAEPNVPGESNDCALNITVLDKVGNKITYAKEFAVDTNAPRIQVERTTGVCQASFAEGENKLDLFNNDVTYVISVTDINLKDCALTYQFEDGQQTVVGMADWQKNGDVYTTTLKVTDGQVLQSWSIAAKDQCGNTSDKVQVAGQGDTLTKFDGCTYSGAWVAVDTSAPEITVSKAIENGKYVQTITEGDNAIDLYNGEVTYTVKVEDEFLVTGKNSIAQLVYTVEGKGTTTVDLLTKKVGQPSIFSNDMDVYQHTFTLEDGDVLTALSVEVKDNATNQTQGITKINDADEMTAFDGCAYSGNPVAVDMTAPAITVTKTVEEDHKYVQTITEGENAIDLYDGEVTYTVTVKDQFLQNIGDNKIVKVHYTLEGDRNYTLDLLTDEFVDSANIFSNDEDVFTASFKLTDLIDPETNEDHNVLTALWFEVVDNAVNQTKSVTEIIDADAKTTFDGCVYSGNLVAVDKTAPVVTVTKEVEEGHGYVQTVTEGENSIDLYDGQVTYTVNVKDQFLASGNNGDIYVAYMLEGDTDWNYINLFTNGNDGSASIFSKNDDVYTRKLIIEDGNVLTDLEIYVCDNAGNVTKELTHSGDESDHSDAFALNEVNNHHRYQGYDLAVDKSAPVVTVTKTVKDGKFVRDVTENGQTVDLYDGQVTYTVNVKDCFLTAVAEDQIGFAKLIYSVEGKGTTKVNLFDCVKDANNAPSVLSNNVDEYEYLIVLDDGDVLTSLQISVEDNAGNVSKQVEVNDSDNKTGFELKTVTEEIEVTEPETTEPEVSEPEVSEPEVSESETTEPEATEPETTEPEITEPETTEPEVIEPETREYLIYDKNWVAVDTEAPKVTITKTVEDGYKHIQTIDAGREKPVDFYNGKVTYTVNVTDQFLVSGSGSKAVVTYKLEGDKTVYSLNLFDKAVTEPSILSHNEDAYTCEFTLDDGDVLEKIEISVMDNAENATVSVNTEDADETGLTTFNGCVYNGNPVCVDMTDPVVEVFKTVEKGSKFIQTYNHTGEGQDTDYYDGKVTYKFVVTDTNLTNAANQVQTLILTYKIDGQKQKSIVLPATEGGWSKEEVKGKDQYTYSFDIEDGKILTDMTVKVIDNARNAAEVVESKDKSGLTVFEGCSYVGNDVLVDATAPKVKINIDVIGDDVKNYYINENGVAYIKLSNKITDFDESGKLNNQKNVTLTMSVTATDENLTLVEDNDFRVYNDMEESDGLTWSGAPGRNKNSTVKFEKSVTVSENTVEILPFCLMVTDLAGNTVPMENIQLTLNGKEAQEIKDQITLEDGMFDAVLAVDRRRPSSVDNGEAPVIEIEPAKKSTITSNNGRELYSKEFNFKVTIADGMGKDNLNAGLAKVRWYFVDGSNAGFVKTNETEFTYKAGTYTKNLTIPVEVNGIGESNKAKLVVIATDNAGNVNKETYLFAIDNEAPRVTVSYNNNTALNGKYFKADRVATITVEDINFDANTTPITTEVEDPGWSNSGIVHTTTRTYNVDGDYTFAMECFDRANNQSEIDLTNGGANVAYDAFTVDKTAPVISISFNPADAKDQDEKNVYHFDTDRTLTVSITEVNFKGEEVVAQMGEKNSLGRWTSNGNIHTAYTTFTPGNEYNVELNYTDLAGNPAKPVVSETFTVDDKAPTIEITAGDMKLGDLNTVQGDLVLGLTVNDAEGNLKGEPEVELIYIGTDFQQKKVEGVEYYTVDETVDRTTYAISFTNIEKIKAKDGIYTLRVKTSDYAGHEVTLASDLVFSLNRFGSTFTIEDEFTKSFLNNEGGTVYQNKVEGDLVIKEINPNEVKQGSQGDGNGSLITVSANGVSKVLVNGADYEVKTEQKGNSTGHKWYEYTYTIFAGNFKDENGELINGKYEILFYSEDAAGNKNTNEANEGSSIQVDKDGNPSGAINFVLDSHTPVVSVIGIEDGSQFNASNKNVQIDVSDNTPHTIEVYIDNVLVTREDDPQKLVNSNDWLTYDEENSSYILNLKEDNFGRDIRVVVIDAAGNPTEHEIKNVQVTENLFFLFINNTWLVVGTVLGLAALIVLIIVLVRRKKEKKEA